MIVAMEQLGRAIIVLGICLVAIGAILYIAPSIPWLGRLPGDITIKRDRYSLFIPLGTSLVASLIISLLLNLFGRR